MITQLMKSPKVLSTVWKASVLLRRPRVVDGELQVRPASVPSSSVGPALPCDLTASCPEAGVRTERCQWALQSPPLAVVGAGLLCLQAPGRPPQGMQPHSQRLPRRARRLQWGPAGTVTGHGHWHLSNLKLLLPMAGRPPRLLQHPHLLSRRLVLVEPRLLATAVPECWRWLVRLWMCQCQLEVPP